MEYSYYVTIAIGLVQLSTVIDCDKDLKTITGVNSNGETPKDTLQRIAINSLNKHLGMNLKLDQVTGFRYDYA